MFYNWPLTLRRRMRCRAEIRAMQPPRYWHAALCVLAAAAAVGILAYQYASRTGQPPALKEHWWLVVAAPLLCGSLITLGGGGAALGRRIVAAAISGALVGIGATFVLMAVPRTGQLSGVAPVLAFGVWRVFLFTILSSIGAAITELVLPEPRTSGGG